MVIACHGCPPASLRVDEREVHQVGHQKCASDHGEEDSGYCAGTVGCVAVGCGRDGYRLVAAGVLMDVGVGVGVGVWVVEAEESS